MGEDGGLPYEYDENELQELADLMPPPLEANPFPSSKIEIKRLLDKHGVRTEATFGTDFEERVKEQEAKQKASLGEWGDSRPDFDDLWSEGKTEEDKDAEWLDEEISLEEAHLIQMTEFGYECMREKEGAEIFEKAMELHHSQKERSRNHYATCMWYAKKLEAAELQENYETAEKNPVPPFIRAMFTLEEDFEALNAKQYDVELKMQEHARAIEDAEYREFLKGTVISMPTKPGSDYHEIFNPAVEEPEETEPELDIDIYLHGLPILKVPQVNEGLAVGILPNAVADKGRPKKVVKRPDAYLNELIFKEDEMD